MSGDRIEREILIDAPIERVWMVLTDAEHISSWFGGGDHVRIDPRPGGTIVFEHGDQGPIPARIERLEPPFAFSYRWAQGEPGEEPTEGNSTLVEFTLEEEGGGGTRLRIVESGFAALPLAETASTTRHDQNVVGWTRALPRLRDHAARLPA